jgi:hypothetical protein
MSNLIDMSPRHSQKQSQHFKKSIGNSQSSGRQLGIVGILTKTADWVNALRHRRIPSSGTVLIARAPGTPQIQTSESAFQPHE